MPSGSDMLEEGTSLWRSRLNHQVHVGDVQAACGHVGGDEALNTAGSEASGATCPVSAPTPQGASALLDVIENTPP